MTAKILKLLLVCLALAAGAYAAGEDVALVTALTGTASASWIEPVPDDSQVSDENRRSHEWRLEVAEMLPAGAEITTGADSELTIIHLAGNVEYNVGASAQVRITADKVEGQDVVSMPVKMVSADLGLGSSMQNQVGAVISDHVDGGQPVSSQAEYSKIDGNKSVSGFAQLSRELKEKKLNFSITPSPAPAPSVPPTRQPSAADNYEPETPNESDEEAGASAKLEVPQTVKMVEACFALPREILNAVSPVDASLEIDDYEIKLVDSFGGWVDFSFNTSLIDKNFNLQISGSNGSLPITLHIEETPPSVTYAWRLEKSGLLAQAASIWLKLQAGGMTETKVAPHLKRIREKLLQSQN